MKPFKTEFGPRIAPLYEDQRYLLEGVNDPSTFKAVFLGGGPGAGKDFVMKKLLQGYGLVEINSDVAFEALMKREGLDPKMPASETERRDVVRGQAKHATLEKQRLALSGRLGVVINGTGDDFEKYKRMKGQLEHMGYQTSMVFVNTADEVSKQRNIERGERGGRTVPEPIRKEKWDQAQASVKKYESLFGDNFANVDNSVDARYADQKTKDEISKNFLNMYKMMRKFVAKPVDNEAAIKWMKAETSKRNITKVDQIRANKFGNENPELPKQKPDAEESLMQQAKMLGLTYFGFGRFGKVINGKHTVTHIVGDNGKLELKKQKPIGQIRKSA